MRKIFLLLTVVACIQVIIADKLYAQSLPVGTPVLEDYYRRAQVLGKTDSNLSFSVRPLLSKSELNTSNIFDPDSTVKGGPIYFGNKHGVFQILPLSWQQQFNSNHPYGWNDGAMIPAKGYQTMVSGGIYFKYGPLSIQLRPEYVYAANPAFNGFASGHNTADIGDYNIFHNLIDWPERFGQSPYKRAFWGQSSIRLNFGPMSIGLSNENLWWGPGIQNALILTNNAEGFKHITINTVRPVKFFGGYIEGQVLAGHLDNSSDAALQPTESEDGTYLVAKKRDDWRYFTGFNINYHVKWIPGLTLGLIRTFDAYYSDVKGGGFSGYVPFFIAYSKQDVNNGVGDLYPRDQITSFYARWLFTKAQAEVYLEYGLEDNSYNLTDFIQTPEHSRAYVFGVRKMIPVNPSKNQYVMVSSEVTQTSQHAETAIREVGLWYVNYQLLQGHTQDGQVLGAGTGPGGNIQSFDLSWISGLKKFGLEFERYEHDVDFAQEFFPPINNNNRNWVDFAFALHGEWSYKNFIFNAKLQEIKSLNYEWILKDYTAGQYYIPHNDAFNVHGELGITYRF